MPLAASDLRREIRSLFDPSGMPSSGAVEAWVRSYSRYAQSAAAGGAVTLGSPLSAVIPNGSSFFDQLDSALRSLWTSAVWVGPGVTAVTTAVLPLQPFITPVSSALNVSFDRELAATLIAEALHTYTLSVVVTITPASGTPVIATVV